MAAQLEVNATGDTRNRSRSFASTCFAHRGVDFENLSKPTSGKEFAGARSPVKTKHIPHLNQQFSSEQPHREFA